MDEAKTAAQSPRIWKGEQERRANRNMCLFVMGWWNVVRQEKLTKSKRAGTDARRQTSFHTRPWISEGSIFRHGAHGISLKLTRARLRHRQVNLSLGPRGRWIYTMRQDYLQDSSRSTESHWWQLSTLWLTENIMWLITWLLEVRDPLSFLNVCHSSWPISFVNNVWSQRWQRYYLRHRCGIYHDSHTMLSTE